MTSPRGGVSAARFTLTVSAVALGLTVAIIMLALDLAWPIALVSAAAVAVPLVVVARSLRQRESVAPRVDPFALKEPWRFYVREAQQAHARVAKSLQPLQPGPLRDRLTELSDRLGHGGREPLFPQWPGHRPLLAPAGLPGTLRGRIR